MKDFYKISEISRLYGVGPDSMRYYERLGLLRPRRDEDNGYRLYSLRDIYKLSVIRDLRTLGLSMVQIKEYLDGQSVESTLALLEREEDLLSRQIHQLQARRETLARREAEQETGLPPEKIGVFAIVPCSSKVTAARSPEGLEHPVLTDGLRQVGQGFLVEVFSGLVQARLHL